jgi:hypothetical protein
MSYRYFKCNVLGGFRISDLNKNIKQNDYFYIESNICDTSRAVKAALSVKWMIEISEQEASQYLSIQKSEVSITKNADTNKKTVLAKADIAIPHIETKTLESRQAEKNFKKQVAQKQKKDEKVILPNFNKADISIRARQNDVSTKGEDEILKSPIELKKKDNDVVKDLSKEIVDNEFLYTPNFDEKKEKATIVIKEQIEQKIRRKRNVKV